MLKIRMRRKGRKNMPFFDIVAVDSKFRVTSPSSERLGYVSPLDGKIKVDFERVKYLLSKGAKFSRSLFFRLKSLLTDSGITVDGNNLVD